MRIRRRRRDGGEFHHCVLESSPANDHFVFVRSGLERAPQMINDDFHVRKLFDQRLETGCVPRFKMQLNGQSVVASRLPKLPQGRLSEGGQTIRIPIVLVLLFDRYDPINETRATKGGLDAATAAHAKVERVPNIRTTSPSPP